MNLPSPSELDYQVGDVVWVSETPYYPRSMSITVAGRRRATVRMCDRELWRSIRVEFGDGTFCWCHHDELRPYEAVDRLADLIRCGGCGERPADCACIRITWAEATGGADSTVTMTYGGVASNCDPISQLGDLVRTPGRRPLSSRERYRRFRRRLIAKRSRRRNRSQR